MLGGCAGLVAVPGHALGHCGADAWSRWKCAFLTPEGRVVDHYQKGISHSEGQAYGLLLAQANGDRETFDQIEAWTRRHLAIRQDNLMGWRWSPQTGEVGPDWHNATDGDLFRAWALLRAERDSAWPGHAERSRAIAGDIALSCLVPDPRAPEEPLLRPSAEARFDTERVLLNPSYIMPRALRELGLAHGLPRLVRAADHGETVLAELSRLRWLPDWVDVTVGGYANPPEHRMLWGHDALRIPLYLLWSGRRDHPAVAAAVLALTSAPTSGHVATEMGPDGTVTVESDHAGYRALLELAHCVSDAPQAQEISRQPYYPASLHLLSRVAAREGGCGAP